MRALTEVSAQRPSPLVAFSLCGRLEAEAESVRPALRGVPGRRSSNANTRRRCPTKQTFDTEVFINGWPMDAESASGELPVRALTRRCV